MDIYNISKTQEELKLEELRNQAGYRFDSLISFAYAVYNAYKSFWYSEKLSPQEQCNLLGNKSKDLFYRHAEAVQFILNNIPNIVEHIPDFMDITKIPEDKQVEYNEDGSVIITNVVVPVESES